MAPVSTKGTAETAETSSQEMATIRKPSRIRISMADSRTAEMTPMPTAVVKIPTERKTRMQTGSW